MCYTYSRHFARCMAGMVNFPLRKTYKFRFFIVPPFVHVYECFSIVYRRRLYVDVFLCRLMFVIHRKLFYTILCGVCIHPKLHGRMYIHFVKWTSGSLKRYKSENICLPRKHNKSEKRRMHTRAVQNGKLKKEMVQIIRRTFLASIATRRKFPKIVKRLCRPPKSMIYFVFFWTSLSCHIIYIACSYESRITRIFRNEILFAPSIFTIFLFLLLFVRSFSSIFRF